METIGDLVRRAVRSCPECGAGVPVDERYVVWCAACDWNVDPGAPDPEGGRIAAARRRMARKHGEQLAAEMERSGESGQSSASRRSGEAFGPVKHDANTVVAFGIALLVNGVTVFLAVAGVLLLLLGWGAGILPAIGALMLGLAWLMRPRRPRLPKDGPVLYRADAPELFALIDDVADVVGTTGVHVVVVDTDANASVTNYGLRARRLLTIGLGLWEILSPHERVALLGHELGHFANGDTRRGAFMDDALRALAMWNYVLTPLPHSGLVDRIMAVLMWLPRWTVFGLLTLLDHLTLRQSQRAEYLADRSAARAGSTEAAAALMDRLLVCGSVGDFLRRESVGARTKVRLGGRDGRADGGRPEDGLWERLAANFADMPEHEYERLRRVAALRGHSVDATHPPTHLRRRCAAVHGPFAPQVPYAAARAAAVAGELAPARAVLAREVIRDHAG
ncbi:MULTISPECIES: M48 family metallopeptidase [unclassified Streptomyces]|uniref:M48 family metallopeptidase n=1 Tax=unclassified Streptomyces TaxID=2593676 RepID=UPI001EF88207|nr:MULTISPECIES: M48 family metallopeptidase [unclassified Streptomyces]